jgi:hypothetical protein
MLTGERGQRATAMMVGEVDRCDSVDRRETADAVKRFCLELRGCCGESSSTERGRTRPLNRILEAAKIRREPKRALSEQNERGLFWEQVGRLYKISKGDAQTWRPGAPRESVKGGVRDALNGVPKTASKAAVFRCLPTDRQLLLVNFAT